VKTLLRASILALAALSAGAAQAADDTDSVGPMPVTGDVPAMCSAGAVEGGDTVFALGVIVDTATGFLLSDLTAPPKTLAASFCNTRSTISISATPMTAQAFAGPAPQGFSNAVDYTATASGWTDPAARYNTGEAAHPDATQTRPTAFTGDITVDVSAFTTVGGNTLRMVADPLYQGLVTVTLAAVS